MRSLKSRLFGFGVAAFFGTIVVVGCSASGGDGDLSDISQNEPEKDAEKLLPTDPDEGEDAGKPKDAGKKDASSKDASKDAAPLTPSAPETGDSCVSVDQEFSRACGMCGVQEALCLADNTVSDYGVCKNQKVNGCTPGTTEEIACGNCGKVVRTCSKYCEWTQGGCSGQPANSCSPGSVEFTDASCGTANTYKFKTCQNTCTWGSLTTTCAAPPTTIQVAPTAGSTNTTLVVLDSAQTLTRIPYSSTCPIATTATFGTASPYRYIEIKNPNPKATSVAIWTAKDPSASTTISTYVTSYDGSSPPASTETARRACKVESTSSTSSSYPYEVTIAPNASISLLIQASSASYVTGTGTLLLNVRTDTVAP